MPLSINTIQPFSSAGSFVQFEATGGVEPYVYSLVAGGDGGSINSSTGLYQAPFSTSKGFQIVRVTDATPVTPQVANFTLNFLNHLQIIADIISTQLGLADDQVYIYNQKFNVPKDNRMYVAIKLGAQKVFGTSSKYIGTQEMNSINMQATVTIDVISRSLEALNRKEEIFVSLVSQRSQQIQNQNAFRIAQVASSFVDLSGIEGAAIPFRFNIAFNILYAKRFLVNVEYFDEFPDLEIETNE
jgi:hypothetical protein